MLTIVFKEINNQKLKNAFDYFDHVKNDLLINSQITIRYFEINYIIIYLIDIIG